MVFLIELQKNILKRTKAMQNFEWLQHFESMVSPKYELRLTPESNSNIIKKVHVSIKSFGSWEHTTQTWAQIFLLPRELLELSSLHSLVKKIYHQVGFKLGLPEWQPMPYFSSYIYICMIGATDSYKFTFFVHGKSNIIFQTVMRLRLKLFT